MVEKVNFDFVQFFFKYRVFSHYSRTRTIMCLDRRPNVIDFKGNMWTLGMDTLIRESPASRASRLNIIGIEVEVRLG